RSKRLEGAVRREMGAEAEGFLAWLAGAGEFRTELLLGLDDIEAEGPPAARVADSLRIRFPDAMKDHPMLGLAFARAWALPPAPRAPNDPRPRRHASRLHECFAFYVENRKLLAMDFQTLPWQLLVHVVDNEVSIEERL